MENEKNENIMSYPEDFNKAVDSIFYVPEAVRPAIMAAFLCNSTFGMF